ncbi:MauE/DoxX family redox-associated membrane protein [Actinomadura chokoriensis]|uniref:Methylamine utilisation protein MauE domain-containing protein n=1 Tax=Actinomadura chokoriensis TaxID=454156 RepID=A0ABV4R6D2_9ACTN
MVTFQNTQVLLLAAVLLAACLAKLIVREPADATDRVHGVPVPAGLARVTAVRRSRGLTVGLGLGEGVLGLALLVTSHLSVRLATTVAFAAATWVVGELRVRRPDAGCGCFGGLSGRKVGRRSVLRAVLFTGAALASLGAPLAGVDVLRDVQVQVGLVFAVEVALFAALSPELAELAGRRRRPADPPCERRRSPMSETFATLHRSEAWARHENAVVSAAPLDVWREGCWRFVAYAGRVDDRDVEIVFAVSTAERARAVRSAVVAAEAAEVPAAV